MLQGSDLFVAQSASGDWYFNNNSMKGSGFSAFRSAWGNRPDVDNWRRMDAVSKQIAQAHTGSPEGSDSNQADLSPHANTADVGDGEDLTAGTGEISYDVLKSHLPLTDAQMQHSNNKIAEAFFNNGDQFQNQLEDYNAAIDSYDSLIKRFPGNDHMEEVLFDLYYCYQKLGRKSSADSALTVLNTKYKNGKFAALTNAQQKASPKLKTPQQKNTKKYTTLFRGKFEEAKAEKTAADSFMEILTGHHNCCISNLYTMFQNVKTASNSNAYFISSQFASSPLSTKAKP